MKPSEAPTRGYRRPDPNEFARAIAKWRRRCEDHAAARSQAARFLAQALVCLDRGEIAVARELITSAGEVAGALSANPA